jgi:hypothetical protein
MQEDSPQKAGGAGYDCANPAESNKQPNLDAFKPVVTKEAELVVPPDDDESNTGNRQPGSLPG